MSSPALERLLGVMAGVFRVSRDQLSATTEAEDIADWDSMRTIYLATAVEAEFQVTLTPEEMAELQSVPAILEILARKGVA